MFSAPSSQQLALACGSAGAYVDVTDDLVTDSVKGSWGRTSGFNDTRPGVFSFDLVNDTGKYTPGNVSSSLATSVRVGMGVHHIVDGVHFSGTIRAAEPYFVGPDGLSGSARVRVTCDDLLGNASRLEMDALEDSLYQAAFPLIRWTLDDPPSSGAAAADGIGPDLGTVVPGGIYPAAAVFGSTASHIPASAVVALPANSEITSNGAPFPTYPYGSSTVGVWSFWVEVSSFATAFYATASIVGTGTSYTSCVVSYTGNALDLRAGGPGFPGAGVVGPVVRPGVPYYVVVTSSTSFSAGDTTVTYNFYVDGVSYGSSSKTVTGALTDEQRRVRGVAVFADSTSVGEAYFSRMSHTLNPINELPVRSGVTESVRLSGIAAAVPEISLETLPTNLSTAPLGAADTEGQSALDAFNDVVRTEQGYMWIETTGTLLSPVSKLKIRARERPDAVDAAHTFSVSEILNAPDFSTTIENMVATATARGPVASATVTDLSLIPYVGSASDSKTVLLRDSIDLTAWAQDRLLRGAATGIRLPQVTLDALAINRWADVSALKVGDRIRITGLPSQQLGVSYIDGWLVGGSYSLAYPSLHGDDQMLFTFYMQPVLPATAVYDTNRYMAGGDLTLSSTINSSVTSISVATTGATFTTSGSDLPLNIIIDGEEMTVTACTSATPQVMTVTRGQNGTTAASHTSGALVELATASLYAF